MTKVGELFSDAVLQLGSTESGLTAVVEGEVVPPVDDEDFEPPHRTVPEVEPGSHGGVHSIPILHGIESEENGENGDEVQFEPDSYVPQWRGKARIALMPTRVRHGGSAKRRAFSRRMRRNE